MFAGADGNRRFKISLALCKGKRKDNAKIVIEALKAYQFSKMS
jgi:hypothetical protein